MAESHLQVNNDGSLISDKTNLIPKNKETIKDALVFLFERNNWVIKSIENPTTCLWKIQVSHVSGEEININLLISSIRDEARQQDEFKTQFGGKIDFSQLEEGWVNMPLGAYVREEDSPFEKWLFAAFTINGINFLSNPSFRGVRTKGLQMAQTYGFIENENCMIFRPEFIYYVTYLFYKRQSLTYNEKMNEMVAEGMSLYVTYPQPLQQILYGAPGVGKSFFLKSIYANESDVSRITFHPETDYSSFVGCYKPVQKSKPIRIIKAEELINKAQQLKGVDNAVSKQVQFLFDNVDSIKEAVKEMKLDTINKLIKNYFGWNNDTYLACILKSLLDNKQENDFGEIIYQFTPQTFSEAYVEAWRRFYNDVPRKDYFLVIEEINRGNCAQIFGDIFQLLDRNEEGFSDYSVTSDKDLSLFLKAQFTNAGLTEKLNERHQGLGDGVVMILPPNLHILGTMNTSDQSLFPIDSAFKRRWEWVYMPIETKPSDKNGEKITREIEVGNNLYDWGKFLENVNQKIYDITQSEDKQLGFWFVKPKNGNIISAKEFVSKVIFYLWNDIYKDFGDDASSIFNFSIDGDPNSNDKERHSFKQFTPHFQEIDINMVDAFLKNLDLNPNSKKTDNSTQTETETVSENEVNNADNN